MNSQSNNKKVGILTFHRAENYGSILQAYALQKYLEEKMNIKNELIDYVPQGQEEFYKLFVPVTSLRNLVGNFFKLTIAKRFYIRRKSFQNFIQNNLTISKKRYVFSEKDEVIAETYSCIITGSDQIWNTECADFSWKYLLEDISNVKKISYAASMGGGKISEPDRYKSCLEEYTAISVREEYAKIVINQMFNGSKEAEISVDPTLLLDKEDYDKIISPRRIQHDYIFLYSVYHDEELLYAIKSIKKIWGLPIITLISRNNSYRVLFYGIKLAKQEGPEDFLSYIKYAKFVITNSFHGSVFSMIYGKEFYYLGDYRKDPRLKQLFAMTGMEKSGVCYSELAQRAEQFGTYGGIDLSKKIANIRKKSEEYLQSVLY